MNLESYRHRYRKGAEGEPVVFAFHGTGGNENQFFDLAEALFPNATIVAPRGDVSEGGALRFFRRKAEGVYDMDDLLKRTAAMIDFVKAHAEAAAASRIVGLGYSNGANILASAMLTKGDLFESALLMHPLIPWTPEPNADLAGRKIWITAGRHDPICPPEKTEAFIGYLKDQKAVVEAGWHDGGHEIRENELELARKFAA